MYVTRPLSLYKNSPSAFSSAPPEGPNTGILVIQDDDAPESRCCFGLCRNPNVNVLPFPQNKNMQLYYTVYTGSSQYYESIDALVIPVLDQPLSSNQYYLIKSTGKHKGLAITGSKEEDMKTTCFCRCVRDIPPQPFDPTNPYQHFQIDNYLSCGKPYGFTAKTINSDGYPPRILRYDGWNAFTNPLKNFHPTEALGLDAARRARLPDLPSKSSTPVLVGRWYCPFIFIRDGPVETRVKDSPYYEMTMEQSWVEVFGCENKEGGSRNMVAVDVSVERRGVLGGERERVDGGVMWFEPLEVGVRMEIVERVRWEQERGGFKWGGSGERERVRRREEFGEIGVWGRFGCYVLVERYVLKRMDGSLVLKWEFKHTHQIRCKWE